MKNALGKRSLLAPLALLLALFVSSLVSAAPRFVVRLSERVAPRAGGYSGRLFVFLSKKTGREPRRGPDWFNPEPFFATDVNGVRGGDERVIDDSVDSFPEPLGKLPAGKYFAQAVLDHDLDHHNPGTAPGNFYSAVGEFELDGNRDESFQLDLELTVEPTPFPATELVRELRVESPLLSQFHGRPMTMEAAVALPKSYLQDTARRYPVVYVIPGFGGTHRDAVRMRRFLPEPADGDVEFVRVYLNADCKWGHHCFADGATNGPRGTALTTELIPRVDADYRTVAEPTARFVTGHSSGGWSSLWLVVNYPRLIGGCWSTAPDSADFRDFEQVDIYNDANIYVDASGNRRPVGRPAHREPLWFDIFCRMDDVLKRGGQMRSFEAVFSPRAADGEPGRLWDRQTGAIDHAVARDWEKYDIRLILERDWSRLGPLLAGKIHVWTGEQDTFFLDGPARLLKQSLARLGSDAEITLVPDRNHSTLLTPELFAEIYRQMSQAYLRHHPAQ